MSKAVYAVNRVKPDKKSGWSIVFYIPGFVFGRNEADHLFGDNKKDYAIELPTDFRYSDWKEQGYGFNVLILGFGFSFSFQRL